MAQWHSHQCIQCLNFQSASIITLHSILFGESTFTYSCACHAEVAVNVELKLQSRNCMSYWDLEAFARVPCLESNYISIANCIHYILWHAIFREAFTVTSGNFAEHIYVKCPPPPKKNNGQNGTWHVLKTSILSTMNNPKVLNFTQSFFKLSQLVCL